MNCAQRAELRPAWEIARWHHIVPIGMYVS